MASDSPNSVSAALARLPKAELHLHLEGCIPPKILVNLAQRYGEDLELDVVANRYNTRSFPEFLELFKWVTSYLRTPSDYACVLNDLAPRLESQNCRYAEITLSVGVMLLRKQDVEANFLAIVEAAKTRLNSRGILVEWVFDAVRQFGPERAMEVARLAVQMKSEGVVAFGLGGDEESLPAEDFHEVYDYVASEGLHRLVHAGEMGGPQSVRDAVEILGAERIGHGIAAIHDKELMDLLVKRQVPLEICPESNLRTGALTKLLGVKQARLEDHPLPKFVARGIPVTLATDDPAMFNTSLDRTYALARQRLGLSPEQIVRLAEAGFTHSFLPTERKEQLLGGFRIEARSLGLL